MRNFLKPEDRKLIEKCLAGKSQAQFELYKKYQQAMYNTIIRMVRRSEDAEDVLQETFVKVFHKLNSFKGDSTLGAWI